MVTRAPLPARLNMRRRISKRPCCTWPTSWCIISANVQSISVAAIGTPSFEVAIEKLVQAAICIVSRLAVVFQPVIEHFPAGLQVLVIESMVCAGIDHQFDWRPVVAPADDSPGAVRRRRPIVKRSNEDERGYAGTRLCPITWGIKRSRRAESQVACGDELFERVGLRH